MNIPDTVQAVKKEVDAAVVAAKLSSIPPPENLWQHIYKDGLNASFRGLDSKSPVTLTNQ